MAQIDDSSAVPYTNGSATALLESHENRILKLEENTGTMLQRAAEAATSLRHIADGMSDIKNELTGHEIKFDNLSAQIAANKDALSNQILDDKSSLKDLISSEAIRKNRNKTIKNVLGAIIIAGVGGFGHVLWQLLISHIS